MVHLACVCLCHIDASLLPCQVQSPSSKRILLLQVFPFCHRLIVWSLQYPSPPRLRGWVDSNEWRYMVYGCGATAISPKDLSVSSDPQITNKTRIPSKLQMDHIDPPKSPTCGFFRTKWCPRMKLSKVRDRRKTVHRARIRSPPLVSVCEKKY